MYATLKNIINTIMRCVAVRDFKCGWILSSNFGAIFTVAGLAAAGYSCQRCSAKFSGNFATRPQKQAEAFSQF